MFIKQVSLLKVLIVISFFALLGINYAQAQTRGASSRGTAYIAGKSGVLLDFGIHYSQAEATGTPSAQDFVNNTSVYDTKLGYITDGDWYFGGIYSVKNYSSQTTNDNGKTGGIGMGYFFRNNFNFRAFYRHNENYSAYREGAGFQADLEYKVSFASNFYVGALISHRQVTFKANDSIANFDTYTLKETFPMISLGFLIN